MALGYYRKLSVFNLLFKELHNISMERKTIFEIRTVNKSLMNDTLKTD